MADGLLKYEDWEGVFDQYRRPEPHVLQRASAGIYEAANNVLLFPNIRNWKPHLLGLNILYFVLTIFLYYQQYRLLGHHTTRPKTLQNVITHQAFQAQQSAQRTALKFAGARALYRLTVQMLFVSTGILPWLWTGVNEVLQHESVCEYSNVFEMRLGHTPNTVCFYLCCALLWTALMLPMQYYEKYTLFLGSRAGGDHDGEEEPAIRAWLAGIARGQGVSFVKIWLFLYNAEGDLLLYGVGAALKTGFYILLARPLVHALGFCILAVWPVRGSAPLRDGNTKRAMETMATKEGFSLAGIYCSAEGQAKSSQGIDVKIYGLPWKRSVVLPEKILKRCNSEEVVALTAFEFGNSRNDPLLWLITEITYHWAHALCLLVLLFNWRAVCESFGFGAEFSYSSQHLFQVIILILGGAVRPISETIDFFARTLDNKFEFVADKIAVEKGYNYHLAKAIIKLEKDTLEVVDLDEVFLHIRASEHNLSERLKRLRWAGEWELPEEGKQHDHWEME